MFRYNWTLTNTRLLLAFVGLLRLTYTKNGKEHHQEADDKQYTSGDSVAVCITIDVSQWGPKAHQLTLPTSLLPGALVAIAS